MKPLFYRLIFFYLAFFDLASGEGFLESNLFLSVDPSPAEHIHM